MTATIGLDSATSVVAVAATREGDPVREASHGPADGRPRHSELLLAEVEECAEALGGWGEVDLIAVGLGPGSYTGLRIGIATARALSQARELPLVGIGTLAAIARGVRESPGAGGRPALAVIDARRGEVATALFGLGGEPVWGPELMAPAELAERASAAHETPLAAGDGSVRFRKELESGGVQVLPSEDAAHRVAARHICALGEATEPVPRDEIEPLYLRAPDADIWLHRDAHQRDDPEFTK